MAIQCFSRDTSALLRNARKTDETIFGRRKLFCLPICAQKRTPWRTPSQLGARLHRQVASARGEIGLTLFRQAAGRPDMQTRIRKVAHVLERLGLAMAGAASGLFVAALVGTSHSALTNQAFLLLMMIGGAIGFYLGIDTPPLPVSASNKPRVDGAW